MAKIIAVANQKGGVGKTTTCINLTACLTEKGKKVLLADYDPQGNSSSGMGVSKHSRPNSYDVLVHGEDAASAIVSLPYGDVLPSNAELSGAEVELVEMEQREFRLKKALRAVDPYYDYIFIDCPPSLGLLTLNAFAAADSLLVPLQCEYYAMEGIADLRNTIRLTQKYLNKALTIEGILLTMYDNRLSFASQVAEEMRGYFGDKVYETIIPRNVRLSEAPSHGLPITEYDRSSKGGKAYMQAAEEFLRRQGV